MQLADFIKRQIERDPDFARAWEESEPGDQVARFVLGLRQQHGLTQEQLAERTGLKRSYIARLGSGDANPTVTTLHRLASALGETLSISVDQPVAAVARTADISLPAIWRAWASRLPSASARVFDTRRASEQLTCDLAGGFEFGIGADPAHPRKNEAFLVTTGGPLCAPLPIPYRN